MVGFTNYTILYPENYTALISAADSYTNSMFSPVILIFIWAVTFLILYGRGNENAIMAAFFMTSICSMFMMVFAGISPVIVLLCIILTAVSMFALPKER